MNQSPYKTLGIAVTATAVEIQTAHRALWRELHPDKWATAPVETRRAMEQRLAQINAARDALLKKNGKFTALAKQLRRQHAHGAGATVHHERHTFYQGGRPVGSVDVLYAEATNAAMRELLKQIEAREPIDINAILGAGMRAAGRRRR